MLPRQTAADLEFECEAEESANRHDESEHAKVRERRRDRHRPDDIGSHEEFKTKQDRPAQVRTEVPVRSLEARAGLCASDCKPHQEGHEGGQPADHHHGHSGEFDAARECLRERDAAGSVHYDEVARLAPQAPASSVTGQRDGRPHVQVRRRAIA